MRLSNTLSFYIGWNFFLSFLAVFISLLGLSFLIEIVELLRRTSSLPNVTFPLILEMGLLSVPHIGRQLFPFAALFGAMAIFWKLSRNQELVVARSSGISVWQFLLPALIAAFLIGVFKVTVVSPLAATTLQRYELLETLHLKGRESLFSISGSGLWLRQASEKGQTVIFARNAVHAENTMELRDVEIYMYGEKHRFAERIDARSAILKDGFWALSDALVQNPEQPNQRQASFRLDTDLTLGQIQDSLARPEVMSFWELPGFIQTLEKAGFSTIRHKLFLHSLLSSPLLMCAMVLVAAIFTLRKQARKGGALTVITGGILSGFILYFFSDITFTLGLSDSIPVIMAAWAPSAVAGLLGVATLFHLEDG